MSDHTTYGDLSEFEQSFINEMGGDYFTRVSAQMVEALNGNGNAAIFLSQLLWWSKRVEKDNGWFYRTREQMRDRCGLGERAQRNAEKVLKGMGLIESDLKGLPAKKHYRIKFQVIISLFSGDSQDPSHGKHQDPSHGKDKDKGGSEGSSSGGMGENYTYKEKNTQKNREEEGARGDPDENERVIPIPSDQEGSVGERATQMYHDTFPRRLTNIQKDLIRGEVKDLEAWSDTLEDWAGNGWSPKSVKKMLDLYGDKEVDRQKADPDSDLVEGVHYLSESQKKKPDVYNYDEEKGVVCFEDVPVTELWYILHMHIGLEKSKAEELFEGDKKV